MCMLCDMQVGACFRTLVVGVDGSPRVYTRALSPDHAQRRQDAYKAFREFTFEAVQSTYKLRGWAAPQLYRRVCRALTGRLSHLLQQSIT